MLEDYSVHNWIQKHQIKTERGVPLDFYNHPFLFDIYRDMSPKQVIMKPAQVGLTLLQMIKLFWVVSKKKLETIYTMPTDSDVNIFVGARMNSLIQQNPILQKLCKDRDTIQTKKIGDNTVYFRGTHSKNAAISVPADLLVMDELDASKQQVVEDYETRLQHSKYKWRWMFSHPSTEGVGVHKYWLLSDQKHWFVTCEHCSYKQYLSWPDSIDPERKAYVCKKCRGVLSDDTRRQGEWIVKHKDREWSGYWITALMCPWIPASEIIQKHDTKDAEFFTTKVLGLPYVGEGNKLQRDDIMQNVIEGRPDIAGTQVVIGVDTGIKLHYVIGNGQGFFEYGEAEGYDQLEDLLIRFPKAIFVFDQGGDLVSPRKFREKHRGRVYLCYYERDRHSDELVRWGEDDKEGEVKVDRNRFISLMVGEFIDNRLPLWGSEEYWEGLWQHCAAIYRVKKENEVTGVMEYKWERSGADHWLHALGYCRVGLSRFQEAGGALLKTQHSISRKDGIPEGITLRPDGTVDANPLKRPNFVL